MLKQSERSTIGGKGRREISEGRIVRLGLTVANWSEKWFPDSFVFAFMGVLIVFLLGIVGGESPLKLGSRRAEISGRQSLSRCKWRWYRRICGGVGSLGATRYCPACHNP